jgi:integrase
LTWERVYLDREHPHAHLIKTKNGEERRVPLSPAAIVSFQHLKEIADKHNADRQERIDKARTEKSKAAALAVPTWDAPLPIDTGRGIIHAFRDAINAVREQAQIAGAPDWAVIHDDLRWHDLRHEAVSRLFELTDMREQEVMEIVGHLSKEMLRHYLKLR